MTSFNELARCGVDLTALIDAAGHDLVLEEEL